MSILPYLACSKKLREGFYANKPVVIYPNYAAYRESPDYVCPQTRHIPLGHRFDPSFYEMGLEVHLYRASRSTVCLSRPSDIITHTPRTPDGDQAKVTPEQQAVIEFQIELQNVSNQFTLPHLYALGLMDDEKDIRLFLATVLSPGDQAELYYCWVGEEAKPRNADLDHTFDLARDLDCDEPQLVDEKLFVRYIVSAPRTPPVEFIPSGDAITVYTEDKCENYPLLCFKNQEWISPFR